MVYLFLADGFEEIEALAVVDILRRAEIPLKTVGINSSTVTGAHNITVKSDITPSLLDLSKAQAIILPGGMPGTLNLKNSEEVKNAVLYAKNNNLLIAAICAAPSILGALGLLEGREAICFPGFEKELIGAVISDKNVCRDGNIITAIGAGAAMEFGFQIVTYLKDSETADNLRKTMKCS